MLTDADSYRSTPQEKQSVLKSIYDAMQEDSKNKLSYLEIGNKTSLTSYQVLTATEELQKDGYVSRFSAREFKYVSFALSDLLLGMLNARPNNTDEIIQEISQISRSK